MSFFNSVRANRNKEILILKTMVKDDSEELAQIINEDEQILTLKFFVSIGRIRLTKIESIACYFKAIKCMDVLENFGLNFKNAECAIAAAAGGSLDIFRRLDLTYEELEHKYYNFTPAVVAAKFGNTDILQYIFSKVSLDLERTYKDHPLIYAAKYGQIDCMNFIIEATNANINKRVFKSLCVAASATKMDNTMAYLYQKFKDPGYESILKEYTIPCDSVYLFQKLYSTFNIKYIAELLLENNSIKILKYLLANKTKLPYLKSLFYRFSDFNFLRLYSSSKPDFYLKMAFRAEFERNKFRKLVIIVKIAQEVQKISQSDFLHIMDFMESGVLPDRYTNECVTNVFQKVPKDSEFINNLFIQILQKGYISYSDSFDLLSQFTGDISEIWKQPLTTNTIFYLWKKNLLEKNKSIQQSSLIFIS